MNQELINLIFDLLKNRNFGKLSQLLKEENPADLAQLMDELNEEDLPTVFRLLPKELAAETFVEMESKEQKVLISAFSDRELQQMMEKIYVDDTVDIIEEMPAFIVKRILMRTSPEKRKQINEILNYPEGSTGSIMTVEFVDLKKNMTVSQAIEHIRHTGLNKETVYTCYVIDERRFIQGLVTVKDLLMADNDAIIGDIMEENIIYANTHDTQEDVSRQIKKYDFLAMPVVDNENRLVGIVTFDDAMDVIEEEYEEDISKMAAIAPSDDNYLDTPIWKHSKNRIVWLLFLMLSSIITGSIITNYQEAFAGMPLLVSFIPMLMGTCGNCGSQSSTTVIRSLAVEDIELRDFFKVLRKEAGISVLVGSCLAVVNAIRILLTYKDWGLALVLGITLIVVIFISKALGVILPMLAKKLKFDPAMMAAPLISTVCDSVSVFVYFNFAIMILPGV